MKKPSEEMRALADSLGLPRLDDKALDLLAQGARSTRDLAGRLPKDLHWTEESALVYAALAPKAGGRR